MVAKPQGSDRGATVADTRRRATATVIRLLLALISFLGSWLLGSLMIAVHGPLWLLLASGSVIVISVATLVGTVHRTCGERDARDDGGGGGGSPRPSGSSSPEPVGGPPDPVWWSEFERQFAIYMKRRARARPLREPVRVTADADCLSPTHNGVVTTL